MITVTFVRHGESEDNTKGIWAGWKDAPLSTLGKKQAQAIGKSLSSTPITHIYTSPLLRAHSTALSILASQPNPKPPLTTSYDLREQHFGVAEGQVWVPRVPSGETLESAYEKGVYPVLGGRGRKFPEGESLDDLRDRAGRAVRACVLGHLEVGGEEVHLLIASHGLCISELVAVLLGMDPGSRRDVEYTGLLNTAWTRVVVGFKDGYGGPVDPAHLPPLNVRVTDVNRCDHLADVHFFVEEEQDEDESQVAARAFFGGAKTLKN